MFVALIMNITVVNICNNFLIFLLSVNERVLFFALTTGFSHEQKGPTLGLSGNNYAIFLPETGNRESPLDCQWASLLTSPDPETAARVFWGLRRYMGTRS